MPGSSPRARGTPSALCTIRDSVRFIPAGAGNTMFSRWPSHISPVHPRGRGEHDELAMRRRSDYGSSPRARGTRLLIIVVKVLARFIPAGAGNTACSCSTPGFQPVHPRGRGEHSNLMRQYDQRDGSSPRARGTRGRWCGQLGLQRFIPAGAGNTFRWLSTPDRKSVHPRGRGEHASLRAQVISGAGSSPRARGTRRA